MRRRIMLALVGVALAAVVLVGAGVLLLAQFGARQSARDRVLNQLDVLAEFTDTTFSDGSADRFQPTIGRLGDAFEGAADLVVVSEDGEVRSSGRDRRASLVLTDAELAELADGPVLVDRPGTVVGLIRVDARAGRGPLADQPLVVLVQREVVGVGAQARAWFLLSAGAVLTLSFAVAGWLAGRFTRPLKEIEEATARIAAGDLETRLEVSGDDELSQLAGAVNRMAADLGRSRAAEQEFLMSVSHDLRTPLTAINGYAEALTDGAVDDPATAGAVIAGNAQRLSRLVGDLLDLARLSARQFRLEPRLVNAADIARNVVDDHLPRAQSYGVDLLAGGIDAAAVVADPDRLAQVVGNLIDNALKFARSKVEILVNRSDEGAATITISVTDDGPGIPSADLPFVFERLYVTRLRPTRAENSSGLGLAIVRELVVAMGGRIEVRSQEGSGTQMLVHLPAAERPTPARM